MQLQLHYILQRYITQHYTTLIALHHTTATTTAATTTRTTTTLHCSTLHYTNYTTLHCNCNYTTLQYATLGYTTLYHITVHNAAEHYTTRITPHHNCNCNCHYTTLITWHYNYNSAATLHYKYNHNCTTPHYIQLWWGTAATIATTPKTQLQPPFGPSVDSLCHPWFTTTNPIDFPFLKLPPPPCAVLVFNQEVSPNIGIYLSTMIQATPILWNGWITVQILRTWFFSLKIIRIFWDV